MLRAIKSGRRISCIAHLQETPSCRETRPLDACSTCISLRRFDHLPKVERETISETYLVTESSFTDPTERHQVHGQQHDLADHAVSCLWLS